MRIFEQTSNLRTNMTTDVKPPLTNDDLLHLVDVEGYYRFPATWDDYWQLVSQAEYRADYYDHHIIASMSYESDIHSRIASEFGFLLRSIYTDKNAYLIYNSNRPVYIEASSGTGVGRSAGAVFNADGMVVSMPRQPYEYRPGLNAETTPVLLIEILSPSTQAYDFGTKLPAYKQIASLQTILYLEQDKPDVIVMERQAPNRWTETRLQAADDLFYIGETAVTLRQIYQGVHF